MKISNFYKKNDDLDFILKSFDWDKIIRAKEGDFQNQLSEDDLNDIAESYAMVLDTVGKIADDVIAKNAKVIDEKGLDFKAGKVIFPKEVKENLKQFEELCIGGLSTPADFGGMNCPNIIATAILDIISAADGSIHNFVGLTFGIADSIDEFCSDEVKAKYLPLFASEGYTGAMALTEPDAGTDLSNVRTKATLDDKTGKWILNGTKRFITNGCGDVVLVLARSEDKEGARGLSFFLVEKEQIEVTKIEHKLGIHGSPTCEIYFNNSEGILIGERGKGLTKYTINLMNHARIGTAAQACGIAQAAYDEALQYSDERVQFGKKIKEIPAVADLLMNTKINLEAMRNLTYTASMYYELKNCLEKKLEKEGVDERQMRKDPEYKKYKKLSSVITPMTKYYTTESCNKIAYDCMQILGGNGYMQEFNTERHYRDARITSIYEGTSQIQVAMSAGGILTDGLNDIFADFEAKVANEEKCAELLKQTNVLKAKLDEAITLINDKKDEVFKDLYVKHLVDLACDTLIAYIFTSHAKLSERKKLVASKFLNAALSKAEMSLSFIKNGDNSTVDRFDDIIYGGN
ncbi:MAG: acyl-CoA dehydrogenase family protein [Pseudomonadota bacterium]